MAGSIIWGTENIKTLKGPAPSARRQPMLASPAPSVMKGQRHPGGVQRRFEVRCAGCRYGGIVERFPDRCPICRGTVWKTVDAGASQSPPWAVER